MPAALRWLLTAVALAGAAWALMVPAFQVPDEDAHFAYAQTLAELHRRPFDDGRPAAQAEKSAEQDLAEQESGFLSSYQRVEMDPSWSEAAQARWLAAHASRRDGGGANPARANQPGYYLYVLPAYWAASGGTVLDRLFLMRLWSVTLALVLTAGAWLLAGELFGRDRPSQLVAAAVTGLWPMASFLTRRRHPRRGDPRAHGVVAVARGTRAAPPPFGDRIGGRDRRRARRQAGRGRAVAGLALGRRSAAVGWPARPAAAHHRARLRGPRRGRARRRARDRPRPAAPGPLLPVAVLSPGAAGDAAHRPAPARGPPGTAGSRGRWARSAGSRCASRCGSTSRSRRSRS